MTDIRLRRFFGMPAWLALSILTVLLWGFWGLQSKLAVDHVSPWMNQALFPLGLLPPAIWVVAAGKAPSSPMWRGGAFYSFLTGILGGTGNITFYLAIALGGKISIVVALTSLFPLVTVILARLVLRESISRAQGFGLVLSVVAIILLGL
jgi:bacterial/archaeal transporter family protein